MSDKIQKPDLDFREITCLDAPELDVYARLREAQLLNLEAPKRGIFIAESPKVIERALNAGACINNYTPVSFNELVRNNKAFQEKDS